VLIANLIFKYRKAVIVPMDENQWYNNRYHNTSPYILKLIRKMEKRDLIVRKKGSNWGNPKKQNYITRIWATRKLTRQFKPIPECLKMIVSKELIELKSKLKRDSKNKIIKDKNGNPIIMKKAKLIQYPDTSNTNRISKILKKINRINNNADITMFYKNNTIRIATEIKAVFTDNFTYHGRLYTTGHHHFQEFSEKERAQILINGDYVIEWDFSGLHPRLLYATEGMQFNDDPYTIVHHDKRVRPFLKVMLLAMINSKDFITAEKACNYWFGSDNKKSEKDLKERKDVWGLGITKARPLMEKFLKAHKAIDKYLCKDSKTGLKIMNMDSRIALDICNYFIKKDRPILPIHDSFVVQEQYSDELKDVMDSTYQKHTKGFTCPIK